jgi:hypothetical protein
LFGVELVRLAVRASCGAARPIDLDDLAAVADQHPGQGSAVAAGPFNADGLDLAELAEPAAQGTMTGIVGGELLVRQQLSVEIEDRCVMGELVSVDACDDASDCCGHARLAPARSDLAAGSRSGGWTGL